MPGARTEDGSDDEGKGRHADRYCGCELPARSARLLFAKSGFRLLAFFSAALRGGTSHVLYRLNILGGTRRRTASAEHYCRRDE